ncbi:MAG: TonB-dependent receptor [Deltaproteobacteria bacterium]|nr:TonB-dependent receptor [Deltaproteobacteria bacterium]
MQDTPVRAGGGWRQGLVQLGLAWLLLLCPGPAGEAEAVEGSPAGGASDVAEPAADGAPGSDGAPLLEPAPGSGDGEDQPAADGEGEREGATGLRFASTVLELRPAPRATLSLLLPRDMESRGAATVAEALALVPGLQLPYHPKPGSSLHVRGFDPRGSLVLLDGIPIREVYAGGYDLSSLTIGHLAALEVERGVPSLLHGPGAMGGVVRLSTLARSGERLSGRLRGHVGQYHDGELDDAGGGLSATRRFGPLQTFLAASHDASNGFRLSADYRPGPENAAFHEAGGRREGSDFSRSMLYGKLALEQGAWKVRAIGNFFFQNRGIPPFESSGYTRYWRYGEYSTYLLGISGHHQGNSNGSRIRLRSVEALAYLSVHQDTIEDFQDASYTQPTRNPLAWFAASSYDNSTTGLTLRPALLLGPGNELELAAGLSSDWHGQRELPVPRGEDAASDWLPWERYRAATFFLAAEDTQQLGRLRLTGGIGASGLQLLAEEHQQRSYPVDERWIDAWEARLFADHELGDHGRLLAAAGRKVRFPTFKELFSNALGGNTGLAPETATMLELGLELAGPSQPRRGSLALRGFHARVSDLIERGRESYVNIDRATISGMELEAGVQPFPWLSLSGAYTFLQTRNESYGRELDYRSPHVATLDLRLRLPGGVSLAGQAGYHARQRAWYVDPLSGSWVEERLPGYCLVHGRLQQELPLSARTSLLAYLQVHNLLDADHVDGSFAPRPGRNVQAGLGMDF